VVIACVSEAAQAAKVIVETTPSERFGNMIRKALWTKTHARVLAAAISARSIISDLSFYDGTLRAGSIEMLLTDWSTSFSTFAAMLRDPESYSAMVARSVSKKLKRLTFGKRPVARNDAPPKRGPPGDKAELHFIDSHGLFWYFNIYRCAGEATIPSLATWASRNKHLLDSVTIGPGGVESQAPSAQAPVQPVRAAATSPISTDSPPSESTARPPTDSYSLPSPGEVLHESIRVSCAVPEPWTFDFYVVRFALNTDIDATEVQLTSDVAKVNKSQTATLSAELAVQGGGTPFRFAKHGIAVASDPKNVAIDRILVEDSYYVFDMDPAAAATPARLELFAFFRYAYDQTARQWIRSLAVGTKDDYYTTLLAVGAEGAQFGNTPAPIVAGIDALRKDERDKFNQTVADASREVYGAAYDPDNLQFTVRDYAGDLCKAEQDFLNLRGPRCDAALRTLLGLSAGDPCPRVTLCISGGGHRAMTGTVALLSSAKRVGLLDCVTYVGALSGSTWVVFPWLAAGMQQADRNELVVARDSNPFVGNIGESDAWAASAPTSGAALDNIAKLQAINKTPVVNAALGRYPDVVGHRSYELARRIVTNFRLPSLVDGYGLVLGRAILTESFGEKFRHADTALRCSIKLTTGEYPLPIGTAVFREDRAKWDYRWVEFSPYEVGSTYQRAFVPTRGFGKVYAGGQTKGRSVDEDRLAHLMGIWGSAFTAAASRIVEHDLVPERQIPLTGAAVRNWAYCMKDTKGDKPTCQLKQLLLGDAGCAFNLPFPPLLRPERHIDVIIACDYSLDVLSVHPPTGSHTGVGAFAALIDAAKYASTNDTPFPDLDVDRKYTSSADLRVDNNAHRLAIAWINEWTEYGPFVKVFRGGRDKYGRTYPTIIYLPMVPRDRGFHPGPSKSDFREFPGHFPTVSVVRTGALNLVL
jgi:hypothetical protein